MGWVPGSPPSSWTPWPPAAVRSSAAGARAPLTKGRSEQRTLYIAPLALSVLQAAIRGEPHPRLQNTDDNLPPVCTCETCCSGLQKGSVVSREHQDLTAERPGLCPFASAGYLVSMTGTMGGKRVGRYVGAAPAGFWAGIGAEKG